MDAPAPVARVYVRHMAMVAADRAMRACLVFPKNDVMYLVIPYMMPR